MTTAIASTPTTPTTPSHTSYRKTQAMLDTERKVNDSRGFDTFDPEYMEIHELILDALQKYPTDRRAANSLDLFPSTFSYWIIRCGLSEDAEIIRKQRDA